MDGGEPGRGGAHRRSAADAQALPDIPPLSGRQRTYLFGAGALLAVALVVGIGAALAARPVRWDPHPAPGTGQTGGARGPEGSGTRAATITDPGPVSPGSSRSAARPSRSPSPRAEPSTKVAATTPAAPPPPAPHLSPSPPTPSPTPVWTSLTVNATKVLLRGDSVQTNRTRLVMQTNGNLAIIDENGTSRWTSGTAGAGRVATFQSDGNFVVYDASARPLWSSRTDRHNGAVLVLQTNGDVCVVDHGTTVWCAGTAH